MRSVGESAVLHAPGDRTNSFFVGSDGGGGGGVGCVCVCGEGGGEGRGGDCAIFRKKVLHTPKSKQVLSSYQFLCLT